MSINTSEILFLSLRRWMFEMLRGIFLFAALAISTEAVSDEQYPDDTPRLASISGDISSIYGIWKGADTGSASVYGTMTIKSGRISWISRLGDGRINNKCSTSYQVLYDVPNTVFKTFLDKFKTTTDTNTKYQVFLIKLKKTCAKSHGERYFRFMTRSDIPHMLEYMAYYDGHTNEESGVPQSNIIGFGHFFNFNDEN